MNTVLSYYVIIVNVPYYEAIFSMYISKVEL